MDERPIDLSLLITEEQRSRFIKKFPGVSVLMPDWKTYNQKNKWYKKKYNITVSEVIEILKNQNHRCAICGKVIFLWDKPVANVDHCHKTYKVRGLLCNQCNSMIGMAQDDIQILQNSISYLEKQI